MIRKHPLFWTILVATLPLLGWWTYGLFDLDEGFYAAVTSEMNRRGEWITPLLNGRPWFEKPILSFWVAKPSLLLFGDMVGPRLPSVLATIATYALVGWFAKRRFGTPAAVVSVLVLASSLLVVALGRMMMTDPLLVLAMTGAFLTFWESVEGDKRWRLVTAFCLGLGVLAKGPIACVLFVPVVGWIWWRFPSLREKMRGCWPAGTAILLLVTATWYLPAYLVDGQVFVKEFLIEQNVGRFSGGDKAHNMRGIGGLVFYVPIVLLGFMPWSFLLPIIWRRTPGENEAVLGYLKAWILVVFVFFTITSAKLPHYMLPLGPPIALLVGQDIARRWGDGLTTKRLSLPLAWLFAIWALAQWGFSSYYYGIKIGSLESPGFHAEIHRLARYVRSHATPTDVVAEYRMGHQAIDTAPGRIKINETSHPSILLYLDRDVLETDDWHKIEQQRGRIWILTRWNRVTVGELHSKAYRLRQVDTGFAQDLYRLYLMEPASDGTP